MGKKNNDFGWGFLPLILVVTTLDHLSHKIWTKFYARCSSFCNPSIILLGLQWVGCMRHRVKGLVQGPNSGDQAVQ